MGLPSHYEQDESRDIRGAEGLHPDLRNMSDEISGFAPLVEMMLGASWAKVRVFRSQVSEMADLVGLAPDIVDQIVVKKQNITGCFEQPDIPVIITEPKTRGTEKLPAILYLHGGGLCLGSAETELQVQTRWSAGLECVVFSPNFRLIPENPYPAAIDDLQSVFNCMVEKAGEYHIDEQRIVVAGYSSGALLAAALTHRLKAAGGHQCCAQLLQFPQLDDRLDYPSSNIYFADVWLPRSERLMWKIWLEKLGDEENIPPDAVPGRAEDFSGLPPAFIHTAEHDHGRDACLAYARSLLEAGVFVDLHLWGGAYHSFDQFQPESCLAKRYMKMVGLQLSDALTGELPR